MSQKNNHPLYYKNGGVLFINPIKQKKTKKEDKNLSCFRQMLRNKDTREKMFNHFDSQYEETKTDKKILNSMTKRRKR